MVQAIEAIRTNSGAVLWRWGGRYRNNKDAMHYEIVCSEASLRSGINWNTVPGYKKPYARPWKAVFRGDTNRTVYSRGGPDNAVWEIQLRLQALGLYSGKIDGIYGAKSAAGIRQFKRNHIGLQRYTGQPTWPNDDEIVGIRTINGLKWWNSHQ